MNIIKSKSILKAGITWGNLTQEQELAFERAITTIECYEKILQQAEKIYQNEYNLEEFGGVVTNIINNDINL